MKVSPCLATALVALLAIAAPAQAADERLESAEKCGRIAADDERLACFDGIFGDRREAAPAPVAAQEAEFGLSESQKQAARPQTAEGAELQDLSSRVARVIPRGMEPPVLELENGQQWLLLESAARLRFEDGDPVVIRRSAWGSYLMSRTDRNGSWRVRRVR